MKQALIDWYNAHIAPGWYRSYALWTGIIAAILPNVPDWLQLALDNWAATSIILPQLSDMQREGLRLVLLLIVLPIARAWGQPSIQVASLKQAVTNGLVVPAGVVGAPVQIMPASEVPIPSAAEIARTIAREQQEPKTVQ